MPQLHLYISDELAARVRLRAGAEGLTVSRYLAELVKRDVGDSWPPGFFENVVGGWKGVPLERAPQGEFEQRDEF